MGHIPHDLREEFPEFSDKLHTLEQNDGHFRRLADEYNKINHSIHRLESHREQLRQLDEDGLRQKRLHLKDEIYAFLKTH